MIYGSTTEDDQIFKKAIVIAAYGGVVEIHTDLMINKFGLLVRYLWNYIQNADIDYDKFTVRIGDGEIKIVRES